ncbi:MAG: phosphoribosyltransferase [Halobacteriota archaeon]
MAFQNRTVAGERLADRLADRDVSPDRVFSIPRGGLPVAKPIADRFDVPLDVVVATKLGAPHNPELAIGAVAGDGSVWLNEELIDRLSVPQSHIDRVREEEEAVARQKVRDYREGEDLGDLSGEVVVLVDDGVATGATARACLRQLRATDAERVVLAVPVAPADTIAELREEADEVITVETPRPFVAVGSHYRDFRQVTDEEAIGYLDRE